MLPLAHSFMRRFLTPLLLLLFTFASATARAESCERAFEGPGEDPAGLPQVGTDPADPAIQALKGSLEREIAAQERLQDPSATAAAENPSRPPTPQRMKLIRGYAILIGTMIGTAAVTSHLSSHLPPSAQFLSYFMSQVLTLGFYTFGSPIWEPASSWFRQKAFGFSTSPGNGVAPDRAVLEEQWRLTQSTYSMNAQMSRNLINQFLMSVQANFYEAHRAMREEDPRFAVEQIAEAAVRMRRLFAELPPDEESVTLAVRAAFTSHLPDPASFRAAVWQRISALDPAAESPKVVDYYRRVVSAWLYTSARAGEP